ncbi:MAG: DJ-1/PfpI family protein [Bacteroidales bacterium]|nr:DJ-1/PfpI family protein [Bacteroidales bacterium]MCF8334584.1 DJ-1/PfpI family protein [Bacteroidales bacterium]
MRHFISTLIISLITLSGFIAQGQDNIALEATSQNQWTGLTVSKENRLFVNFPRWSDNVPVSVGEVVNGHVKAFPDKSWNKYTGAKADEEKFICVQSVFVDAENRLWVLDPANPKFQGVHKRGPRLYHFNLETNKLVKAYDFDEEIIFDNSYLNDVRIDTDRDIAYITDSNVGGILTVDLKSGETNRYLTGHTSVQSEMNYLRFSNGLWENKVASDGIALTPDHKHLYFAALSGHTLYRIPTEKLTTKVSEEDRKDAVEHVASVYATDGMLFDDEGSLYMGGLERNAVYKLTQSGDYRPVTQGPKVQWADSFTKDPEGNIYFTTSQLHLSPEQRGLYKIYQIEKPVEENNGKILMVITSHGKLGETEGEPTGYYLSEVSHAYYEYKKAGYDVDFVSPKGGKSPVDGYDLDDPVNKKFVNDKDAQQKINSSMTPDEVELEDYRGIYYAGGHGTMWDLPENKKLNALTAKKHETGGVIGAVCHGPAGLVNVKLSNGKYLVDGKTVSCFTNQEEEASHADVVPFMLESKLEERGAEHMKSPKWQKKVIVDGRLVTGQNPASAKGVAKKMIEVIGKK